MKLTQSAPSCNPAVLSACKVLSPPGQNGQTNMGIGQVGIPLQLHQTNVIGDPWTISVILFVPNELPNINGVLSIFKIIVEGTNQDFIIPSSSVNKQT